MATPICIADSWSKPLTAIQIAELQPEWDEDDKSNELLPPDAPPTQALPDRTQYYVSKRAPTAGNAVRYRSIRAQRQAACEHEQYRRAIKTGPAAKVRPVRPWPYRFLREKKWRRLDSNLRMRYGVASPSSSP